MLHVLFAQLPSHCDGHCWPPPPSVLEPESVLPSAPPSASPANFTSGSEPHEAIEKRKGTAASSASRRNDRLPKRAPIRPILSELREASAAEGGFEQLI